MYLKFVSNPHKKCVFKNMLFVQVSTVHNIMMHNKREPIGPVLRDRQNGNIGAKDFNMKYFMWQYLKYFALHVLDVKIYRMKLNGPIEIICESYIYSYTVKSRKQRAYIFQTGRLK